MRRSMNGHAMNGEFEAKRSQGTEKSGPTAIRTRVAGSASRRDIQATLWGLGVRSTDRLDISATGCLLVEPNVAISKPSSRPTLSL